MTIILHFKISIMNAVFDVVFTTDGYCFFNITPRRMGATKSNFKNPVVLVSGYSRDRARRGPAIATRGIMDRPDLSGRVRGLMSTTTRRRRFFFYFLTLPSEKSFFPSRQCLR